MYKTTALTIDRKLQKYLDNELPDYPNRGLLKRLIVEKVIEELNDRIRKGIIPEKRPEEDIIDRFKDYVRGIKVSLYNFFIEEDIQQKIRSYNGRIIILIGAGFSSEAGVPLRRHINKFKFEEIRKDPEKIMNFKETFAYDFMNKVRVTEAHDIVAEMFHNKVIIEIVSLNWDNLLERAYRQKGFGDIRKINREDQQPSDDDGDGFYHYLWKFHGDVEDLDYEWILPKMKERVFESFLNYIPVLSKHPLIFLIIGYSEPDNEIKEKVIKPLEFSPKIDTYRIGMDLRLFQLCRKQNKYYIVAPAEWIVPILFEEVKKTVKY